MADKTYVVKALGVIPTVEGGFSALIERGGQVPSNATKEWLEHALALDLIEAGDSTGGLPAPLAGDLTDLPVIDDGSDEPKAPRRSAAAKAD